MPGACDWRTVARYVDLSSIHLAPRGDVACDTADIHRVPEKKHENIPV